VTPVHERFHQEDTLPLRRRDNLRGTGRIDGERLFAQDGLSRSDARHRVLLVADVRRCDVDRVDRGVSQQLGKIL
jgi:hypothetical protein